MEETLGSSNVSGGLVGVALKRPLQVTVNKVKGGFILNGYGLGQQEVCTTIEEVIERIKMAFVEV